MSLQFPLLHLGDKEFVHLSCTALPVPTPLGSTNLAGMLLFFSLLLLETSDLVISILWLVRQCGNL